MGKGRKVPQLMKSRLISTLKKLEREFEGMGWAELPQCVEVARGGVVCFLRIHDFISGITARSYAFLDDGTVRVADSQCFVIFETDWSSGLKDLIRILTELLESRTKQGLRCAELLKRLRSRNPD